MLGGPHRRIELCPGRALAEISPEQCQSRSSLRVPANNVANNALMASVVRQMRMLRHQIANLGLNRLRRQPDGIKEYLAWADNNDRPNMAIGGITPAMKLKLAA